MADPKRLPRNDIARIGAGRREVRGKTAAGSRVLVRLDAEKRNVVIRGVKRMKSVEEKGLIVVKEEKRD